MIDPLKYYFIDSYLFRDVNERFHTDHSIGAFDFFTIVIWKANRAKSKIARKLLDADKHGRRDLEAIVRTLTSSLYYAPDHKERLRLLIKDWKFALPMASAILSVFWPNDFTIYDYRVCDQLRNHRLDHLTNFERIWKEYLEFKAGVTAMAPHELSLRDQDRYLWSKSSIEHLKKDIEQRFKKESLGESTGNDED